MAWIMSLNKNNVLENMMRYSSECLLSAERGFFSSSLEFELESGIGDCLVRGFDRINGIYRIG